MSEQRPVMITAKQFVDGDYAAKIARGECIVQLHNDNEPIKHLRKMAVLPTEYEIWFISNSWMAMLSEDQLKITWLPQPEREEAAAREFADGWRDAEVARLREALESINSMVLDMPIKTGDKDAILDVVSAALASSDSEPDHK